MPIIDRGRRLGRGTVIPLPPEVRSMSTPRAALSHDDGFHLLWGAASTDTGSATLTRVWAARWRHGGWSQPYVFLDPARDVIWLSSHISEVTSAGGIPYIFAPMSLMDTVLVIRLTETGWKLRAAPFDDHGYSAIAGIEGDSRTVFVTYVKQNEIYAGEFDLSENRLTRSSHLASFPVGASIRTRALSRGGDRRVVVWIESSVGNSSLSYLRIVESTDRGASWHPSVPLQVKSFAGIIQATSDSAGRVHVLFDGAFTSPSGPLHAMWDGKEWQEDTLPAQQGFVVPSPGITRWGKGSVLAVWAMAESPMAKPTTFWSIGRPCSH